MTGGSFLASSIQRVTVFTDGRTRTNLRLALASDMASASFSGLRKRSSLTVRTPATRNSSEYSQPMPLTRMRSAAVTQSRTFFSGAPVFTAIFNRCFGVLARCNKETVVLIPSDFRIAATSVPIPWMSVMGYPIDAPSAQYRHDNPFNSNKLGQTGDCGDDFA